MRQRRVWRSAAGRWARSTHRSLRDTPAQVHILEAKNLAARDSGGTSDPIVIVEAFGDKRHTKAKEKMLNCTAAMAPRAARCPVRHFRP